MPCNSDYMNPTQKEKDSREVAGHLCYVFEQIDDFVPGDFEEISNNIYGAPDKLDIMVRGLCELVGGFDKEQMDRIVYNGRDSRARALADWWERHQEADLARMRQEIKENREYEIRKRALDKLTEEEIKVLGLNE